MGKKLCILGSTGSVGMQTAECAAHLGFPVTGLCANRSVFALEQQIRRFRPAFCAVSDERAAAELKIRIRDTGTKLIAGKDSPSELACVCDAQILLNAMTGFAGLLPTLAAIDSGKDVAIANKETLVAAGETVMRRAKENKVRILPVDSEHCAIHQCIGDTPPSYLQRVILTASGGPFFGRTRNELERVTVRQALRHPVWSMGGKITVDSATLVNKGLELIEAMRLYDLPEEKIEVVVHRESIVHSLVEWVDGSVMAQLSPPDMRLYIQYALTYPIKQPGLSPRLDLAKTGSLTFCEPDNISFPSIELARKAARAGGVAPCVYNGANEACVDLFLKGDIGFLDIFELIDHALARIDAGSGETTLADILDADRLSRAFVYKHVKKNGYGGHNPYI